METARFQEKTLWLVRFELLDETWAIRFSDIQEILETKEITPVPKTPSFITGITHKRGKIITVIDLGLLLGKAKRESKETRIIHLKSSEFDIGLLIKSKASSELLPETPKTSSLIVKEFGENEKITIEKSIIQKGMDKINILEAAQLIRSLEEYPLY